MCTPNCPSHPMPHTSPIPVYFSPCGALLSRINPKLQQTTSRKANNKIPPPKNRRRPQLAHGKSNKKINRRTHEHRWSQIQISTSFEPSRPIPHFISIIAYPCHPNHEQTVQGDRSHDETQAKLGKKRYRSLVKSRSLAVNNNIT